MEEYLPILIFIVIAMLFSVVAIALSHIMGKKHPGLVKGSPYECGITPEGSARERVPLKFYTIAMLFILFDIEVVFLYPWAVVYRRMLPLGAFIFVEMLVFVLILLVGLAFVWRKGALEWRR